MTTSQFALFDSPLDLAHLLFKNFLKPEDNVIDATLGNGHDSFKILELIPRGYLYGFDIQEKAIESTHQRLANHYKNFHLYHQSHETFPNEVLTHPIKLVVYNLGYLPGGDKTVTTLSATTLDSCKKAFDLLSAHGVLSIMCYPGHNEGAYEYEVLLDWAKSLDKNRALVSVIEFYNRNKAPCLIWIQKGSKR